MGQKARHLQAMSEADSMYEEWQMTGLKQYLRMMSLKLTAGLGVLSRLEGSPPADALCCTL